MDGPRTSPGHRCANGLKYRRRRSRAPTPINQPSSSGPNRDERHAAAKFSDRAAIGTRDQRGPGTGPRPMKNARPSTEISVNDVATCDGGGGGYNTRLVQRNARADASARNEADTQSAADQRSIEVLILRKPNSKQRAQAVRGDLAQVNRQRASHQQNSRTAGANSTAPFPREARPGTDRYRTNLSTDPPPRRPSGSRNRVAPRRRHRRPGAPKTRSSATERDLCSAAETERTRVREQQTAIATANRNRGRAANHGSPPALPRDGVKRPNRRSAARPPHRPAAPQPANRGNRPTRAGSRRQRRNRKKRRAATLQPRSPNTQRLEKNADSALQPDRSPARVHAPIADETSADAAASMRCPIDQRPQFMEDKVDGHEPRRGHRDRDHVNDVRAPSSPGKPNRTR